MIRVYFFCFYFIFLKIWRLHFCLKAFESRITRLGTMSYMPLSPDYGLFLVLEEKCLIRLED